MLTRKSIVTATLSLSMLLQAISFAQQPKRVGNIAKWNGNTIEFEPQKKMTTDTMTDAEGKQHIMRHDWANVPLKLNGQKLYTSGGEMPATKPRIKAKETSLADYLVKQLTPVMEQQADGAYNLIISNVIINAQGKVVYYENTGIQKIGEDVDEKSTNKKLINNKIEAILKGNNLQFIPATYNGKAVAYLISNTIGYSGTAVVVKNHKVIWKSMEEQ